MPHRSVLSSNPKGLRFTFNSSLIDFLIVHAYFGTSHTYGSFRRSHLRHLHSIPLLERGYPKVCAFLKIWKFAEQSYCDPAFHISITSGTDNFGGAFANKYT